MQHADLRSQRGQHIQQRGARRVQPERIQHQVRAGEESRGAQKERRRRNVAGHRGFDGVSVCGPAIETESSVARQSCAKCTQGQFAVIARAHRLAHRRRPRGLQAGQQNARLHLCAGNWRRVVNRLERRAFDRQSARGPRSASASRPSPPAACESAPSAAAKAKHRRSA